LRPRLQTEQRTGHLFPPANLGLLESPDRDAWQKPEQIMDALGIAEGSKVADIGIGSGWFTIRLARRVGPNGRVYAEDVQRQMLEATRRRVSREGLKNVETILGPRPIQICRRARSTRFSSSTRTPRSTIGSRFSEILLPR
jgi:cyclopropane fatty-acyl-phospholipid synthase-like methyltransferase